MSELAFVLPLLAGIVAGVGWSVIGVWSKWRSGEEKEIDTDKLKKNVAVGAGTGFATWIYALSTGDASAIITGVESFILAAVAYFPLIVVVDKLLTKKQ